jgi:hypothetical protein
VRLAISLHFRVAPPRGAAMCQNGVLTTASAWYRLCKCFGEKGCFITYEDLGTYQCPAGEPWNGKKFLIVSARGRTDKPCAKRAIIRTREIIQDLGNAVNLGQGSEDNYTWGADPGVQELPDDSTITGLAPVEPGKRPDETTKPVGAASNSDGGTTTGSNGGTTTGTSGGTASTGGNTSSSGTTTGRRPRKQTTKKTGSTVSQAQSQSPSSPSSNASIPIGVGIGIGLGLGMGLHGGGDRGDFHGSDRR